MRRVHMLGIGGAGVSALARVLLARGDLVSGCDVRTSETTRALAREGARVAIGHDPGHLAGAAGHPPPELVVHTTPLRGGGVDELEAARGAGLRIQTRAETLAELIAGSESVTVAGSHGKTTTTHMLGQILAEADWDPSVLVGDGASSRAGNGRWLVAEADESDGTVALHRPRHGILTNVEHDHHNRFPTLEEIDRLFRGHLAVIPGVALVGADCPRAAAMPAPGRRLSYGFDRAADYRCDELGRVRRGRSLVADLRLRVPGRHNLQNATGALAMAVELGVEAATAARALAGYAGAHRRLERLGSWRGAAVYDDYGHHPTEVRATLAAARELGGRRLLLVFQPHRYSRYRALRDQLAESLRAADAVIVTEIYGAGEPNPGGLSAAELADGVPGSRFAPDLASARLALEEIAGEGDLVLVMGAGDVVELGRELANSG